MYVWMMTTIITTMIKFLNLKQIKPIARMLYTVISRKLKSEYGIIVSIVSMSPLKRFKIRPIGVVSKKVKGHLKIANKRFWWMTRAAFIAPKKRRKPQNENVTTETEIKVK